MDYLAGLWKQRHDQIYKIVLEEVLFHPKSLHQDVDVAVVNGRVEVTQNAIQRYFSQILKDKTLMSIAITF